MTIAFGCLLGFAAWFVVRYLVAGFYTIDQNERAVMTRFGRAHRLGDTTTANDPVSDSLRPDEKERYACPQVQVIGPGFYWKWPWQRVHRISIATETLNMAFDPEMPMANQGGTILDAVTKDQLNHRLERADSFPGLRAQSLRLPVQEHRSAGFAGGERQQLDGALS